MAQDVQPSGLGPGLHKIKMEVVEEEVDLKPDIIKYENPDTEDGGNQKKSIAIKSEDIGNKKPVSIKSEVEEVKIKSEPKESWIEIEVDVPIDYGGAPSTSEDMPSVKKEPLNLEQGREEIGGSSHEDGISTVQTSTRKGKELSNSADTAYDTKTTGKLVQKSLCSSLRDLTRNASNRSIEKPFSCDICGHKFKIRDHLTCHLRIHTGEKPFSCNYCDHKTAYKSALTKHIRTHTGEIPVSCELCSFQCRQRRELLQHLRIHKKIEPLFCKICNYKYKTKGNLMRHMLTHSDEKLCCDVCNFKTVYKSALVTHIGRYHTIEKPFSCDLCNKYKTGIKSDLIRHKKNHTELANEKLFCCNFCSYKCKRKVHLKSHLLTHTGEKPFSCNICDYKAAQKNTLTTHIRTHTGEKPFSCDLCDYKCKQKPHLRTHILRHHKGT